MSYEIDEHTPIIGKLINAVPSLFNRTEIIGVFKGEDICSSFLNHGDILEKQDWYENYHCFRNLPLTMQTDKRNDLESLYKSMMAACPNLIIHSKDGVEFHGNADFTFIDIHNQPFDAFCATNTEKLTGWYATCGFGGSIEHTVRIIKMFENKTAFPVMKYKDNIFMTGIAAKQDTYVNLIVNALHTRDYSISLYNDTRYINILGQSGYDSDIARQLNDQ